MDPSEFHDFTNKGKFTVRRSKKYWCEIWSDQTIEQTLMKRSMKARGGITRRRGFSDNVLSKWTLAMIVMQNVCDEIENFCDVHYETSEQHVDTRSSRIDRDRNDSIKLQEWLSQHPHFADTDTIKSLSSGIIGGPDVNCHLALEIGMEMVTKMVSYGNFKNVTFKRKHKVVTLTSVGNSFKAGTLKVTAIDPLTLFQRLCLSKQSNKDTTTPIDVTSKFKLG
uniref:Putative product n=1 Tax=Xenopsylla cheopis TaxID=163159 RepID=A0A6M2DQ66_XENCH